MNNFLSEMMNLTIGLEEPIGRTVNMTIFVLFLVGMLDVFYSVVRISLEKHFVRRARASLRTPDAPCPAGPVEELLKFLRVSPGSVLGKRVTRIIRLRSAGLGQRDVLKQLTREGIDRYGALARYIGMILTLLGLLGTVIGLSFAVVEAQEVIVVTNDLAALGKLAKALGGTLQGMKTAFATTLAGLLTSLVLSFGNHAVRRTQLSFAMTLEDFLTCDLLPELERIDPEANESAKAFANVLSLAAKDLNGLRESISGAAEVYLNAGKSLSGSVETLHNAVQSFNGGISQVVGNQQLFTQTMSQTREALEKMVETISKQFEALHGYIDSSNKVLGERLSMMEEITKSTRITRENLDSVVHAFQQAIEGYHGQFKEETARIFAEFKTALQNLLVETNQHYREGVVGHISSSHKVFEETVSRQTAHLQQVLDQTRSGFTEALGQHGIALRAFSDMVVDVHGQVGSLVKKSALSGNGVEKNELN
jgi:hypothetical protein